MRDSDFKGELTNGQIAVPPEIAAQVPPGETVSVVLQWGDADGDDEWRMAGRKRFESAYSPDDSIYESLINDDSVR